MTGYQKLKARNKKLERALLEIVKETKQKELREKALEALKND